MKFSNPFDKVSNGAELVDGTDDIFSKASIYLPSLQWTLLYIVLDMVWDFPGFPSLCLELSMKVRYRGK